MTTRINYVQVGERYSIPIRTASGGELSWEGVVAESCGDSAHGYWYCLTCDQSPAHNLAAARHWTHKLAWICTEHGPEVIGDAAAP